MDHHLYMFTFTLTVLFHSQASDDDHIDRLNRKYTVYALIALAVISGSGLLTGNLSSLITCWNRANYPSAYINYTNYFCFIANSYRVDPTEAIPDSIDDRLFSCLLFSRVAVHRSSDASLYLVALLRLGKIAC